MLRLPALRPFPYRSPEKILRHLPKPPRNKREKRVDWEEIMVAGSFLIGLFGGLFDGFEVELGIQGFGA
ncbi:MAG: hypothetical protein ACI8P2_003815 [Candidatus Latescibacterota bacterium]|jgi:hypothetical protein